MAEQFRGGLRLSPPESEWVRVGPIASNAGQFPWRNYSAADSAWVRLGPSTSAADAGGVRLIQFRRGTKNSAAESAADSADCRGTNLFRRGSDRIRCGLAELPPAECTEKGPRESATRIFRECPPRTFEKFRLRGTIPRLLSLHNPVARAARALAGARRPSQFEPRARRDILV